ncbi:hypothetical protein [Halpernia sp. GG3]
MASYWLTDFAHPIKEYDDEYKQQTAAVAEYNEKRRQQASLENCGFL